MSWRQWRHLSTLVFTLNNTSRDEGAEKKEKAALSPVVSSQFSLPRLHLHDSGWIPIPDCVSKQFSTKTKVRIIVKSIVILRYYANRGLQVFPLDVVTCRKHNSHYTSSEETDGGELQTE